MKLPASARSVITGAGSGFGRALALELAARGGHLVLSDINRTALEETAQLARQRGAASTKVVLCDVTKLEEVQALAAACEGPVDLLVNNAGVSSGGLIGEVSMEDWRWTIEVDLFGVIHGCHVFVPIFKKQGHGHVLNVASAAGLLSGPRMGAYNVAKAGVVALSETMAAEFAGTRLGVTALCPTFFATNIVASGRFADEQTRKLAEKFIKTPRTAEEVARYALGAIERNELYALPMADGRLMWRLKRALPTRFSALVAGGLRLRQRFGK